jgi:hypothetical protein
MNKDPGFMWFAARTTNIENFIKDLAKEEDPNDEYTQERLAGKNGLWLETLTSYEKEYVERQVAKLWAARY